MTHPLVGDGEVVTCADNDPDDDDGGDGDVVNTGVGDDCGGSDELDVDAVVVTAVVGTVAEEDDDEEDDDDDDDFDGDPRLVSPSRGGATADGGGGHRARQ